MLMKKPNHRIFDYQPRFYDPLNDEEERKKRKIHIGMRTYSKLKPKNTLIKNLLLLVIGLVIYWIIANYK